MNTPAIIILNSQRSSMNDLTIIHRPPSRDSRGDWWDGLIPARGSFLIRRQRCHPDVVYRLSFLIWQIIRKECNYNRAQLETSQIRNEPDWTWAMCTVYRTPCYIYDYTYTILYRNVYCFIQAHKTIHLQQINYLFQQPFKQMIYLLYKIVRTICVYVYIYIYIYTYYTTCVCI